MVMLLIKHMEGFTWVKQMELPTQILSEMALYQSVSNLTV